MWNKGTMVLLLAVVGCGTQHDSDAGWVQASDALAAHGVAQYRAQPTAGGQQLLMRDSNGKIIGELQLVVADTSSTVSLELRADSWKQILSAADGKMTLWLDGREATLRFDGSSWTGDAAAQALLTASQPYADFVQLLGVEARLGSGVAMGTPSAPAQPETPAASAPDLGSRPQPTLCCGDLVTTGSGWAWYWENNAQAMACKRAVDAVQLACAASSGYDCCNVQQNGCTACVNWGTGWSCSTAGYLKYEVPASTVCK